jgi:hypothetical protein
MMPQIGAMLMWSARVMARRMIKKPRPVKAIRRAPGGARCHWPEICRFAGEFC